MRVSYTAIHEFFWDKVFKSFHKERTEFLVEIFPDLKVHNKGVMLGLGVAEDNVDYLISRRIGLCFVGLDIKSKPSYRHDFNYVRADASLLPFERESFDIITAFSLIEHIKIERRYNFLTEISRVLKNDGLLVLQLPNRFFPVEQHSSLPFAGYLPDRFHNYFNNYYCRVPSFKSIKRTLKNNGYKVIKIISYELPLSICPIVKILKVVGFFKILPFGFILICQK